MFSTARVCNAEHISELRGAYAEKWRAVRAAGRTRSREEGHRGPLDGGFWDGSGRGGIQPDRGMLATYDLLTNFVEPSVIAYHCLHAISLAIHPVPRTQLRSACFLPHRGLQGGAAGPSVPPPSRERFQRLQVVIARQDSRVAPPALSPRMMLKFLNTSRMQPDSGGFVPVLDCCVRSRLDEESQPASYRSFASTSA